MFCIYQFIPVRFCWISCFFALSPVILCYHLFNGFYEGLIVVLILHNSLLIDFWTPDLKTNSSSLWSYKRTHYDMRSTFYTMSLKCLKKGRITVTKNKNKWFWNRNRKFAKSALSSNWQIVIIIKAMFRPLK